jgi:ABC-2 type transport system ATP-binding protein
VIQITGVTKTYFGETIVDNLSLSIREGTVFGFLGQNGAGKTTAMKMMVGISNPDLGEITVGGKSSNDVVAREKIGYMPEAPYFYDRLTGLEFLEFCGNLFSVAYKLDDDYYAKILKEVGIFDARNKAINTYSKGMKQRLGFAQALVNNPEYIFLDEPLDGLDPIGRKEIKEIIKKLHDRGKTIFFNSHILYDTEELCDKVGIIHRGCILDRLRNFVAIVRLKKDLSRRWKIMKRIE